MIDNPEIMIYVDDTMIDDVDDTMIYVADKDVSIMNSKLTEEMDAIAMWLL